VSITGRTSNKAAFVYQLFVRASGSNNLPDCSNMCHESTSVALQESIGIGEASVTLEDLHQAELIVIAGQNPGTNHPRMLPALEIAKANGARIISVNALREAGLIEEFKQTGKPVHTGNVADAQARAGDRRWTSRATWHPRMPSGSLTWALEKGRGTRTSSTVSRAWLLETSSSATRSSRVLRRRLARAR